MEELFWLNILTNEPVLVQKLRIRSTNLSLLTTHEQFLEPVYNSEKTIQFIKDGQLQVAAGERVKLFSFL
jgi:hypothetical protein